MDVGSILRLADQVLLNIDTSMGQLMHLRKVIENIKTDCSKLQRMAGVSTPALRNGTDAAIATVLNNRARTIAKRHFKAKK